MHTELELPMPRPSRINARGSPSTTRDELRELCVKGLQAQARRSTQPKHPETTTRLDEELTAIHDGGLAEGFLAIRQIIGFSREQDILIRLRGPCHASLVLKAIGLNQIDPMQYDLIVPRFDNYFGEKPELCLETTTAGFQRISDHFQSLVRSQGASGFRIRLLWGPSLDQVQAIRELVKRQRRGDIHPNQIPTEDQPTSKLIGTGDTEGILHLSSHGMRDVLRRISSAGIEAIAALIALYRPGPIRSGHLEAFIHAYHRTPGEHTVQTAGLPFYREDLVKTLVRWSGLSTDDGWRLIDALIRKQCDEVERIRQQFLDGGRIRNETQAACERTFEFITEEAIRSFSKSHVIGEALLAWQLAYLKANYRAEFDSPT